ncbi:MAG: sulfurtransferase [Luteimonas sp.]
MIVNLAAYQFVAIDAPDALAQYVRTLAERDCLLGSVLVADEGINLFLAGENAATERFLIGLKADPRLADIRVKFSRSERQPFARLKVKVKPEIIAFRRDGASPQHARAPTVSSTLLARWIAQDCDDAGKRLVLLDTRNREEVAHGTFDAALTLPIDNFTELPDALAAHRDALADATVVSFCTGGIRCEKAALWMRATGMDNVLQLDGGILGYFEAVGGMGYSGDCFVFDKRIALNAQLRPRSDAAAPAPAPRCNDRSHETVQQASA